MNEQEFNRLAAEGYNRIPLYLETFADLDTPLSTYLKLANAPNSYLLESVQGGERFGRYSVIGLPARDRVEVIGRVCRDLSGTMTRQQVETDDPIEFVRTYLAHLKVAPEPALPRFCGGLVGYFGYDTVRYVEKRLAGMVKPDPIGTPDILLLLSDEVAVFDNLRGKIFLVVYVDPQRDGAFMRGQQRLAELLAQLRTPVRIPEAAAHAPTRATSEFSEDAFAEVVDRAKRYIVDGDIMQVVLSQRTSQPYDASPLSLYRALRATNPSPYMFLFDFGGFHVVGASPEILVRLESGQVTVRPIAGTRPRGDTRERDEALATELLADPKERAEHVMLIDLERNDLGRVCEAGSVRVSEFMCVESYSHVHHIVSQVEGQLRPDVSPVAALAAVFPGGTITGCPKLRCMEIIAGLETIGRGPYTGSIGLLGIDGSADFNILIRTLSLCDGVLRLRAGAGIVADSVPERELEETRAKARGVLAALRPGAE